MHLGELILLKDLRNPKNPIPSLIGSRWEVQRTAGAIAGAIGASGQAKNWVFPAFLLLSNWDRLKTKLLGLEAISNWAGACI